MLKWSILFLILSFVAYKFYFVAVEDSPTVQTENGSLKGKVSVSRNGRRFYEYLGIPYAQPPVGELRYESPQASKKWKGVRDAQELGAECPQINILTQSLLTTEDCLFLNVFTPAVERTAKLPVIVFFHGGLFVCGSSNDYRPNYFIDEGVVLVTINYRLAALGFLNTGDGLVRGNMGLKDQTMALQWVQNNIEHFGGDKNSVTIIGESAGGASVNHHLLSPISKGLFHRAISQSGSSLNPWALKRNPGEQAKRYAQQVNCPTSDTKEMVACLKGLPASVLIEAHAETNNMFREREHLFAPTVEVIQKDAFLPGHPYDLMRSGKVNAVPWMSGYNADEGLIFFALLGKNESELINMGENLNERLPLIMYYDYGDKTHRDEFVEKIRKFYFGSAKPDGRNAIDFYNKIFTDGIFAHGISEALKLHSEFQPVFPYYYNYDASMSVAELMLAMRGKYPVIVEALMFFAERWINQNILGQEPPKKGVSHADELQLLFQTTMLGSAIGPGHRDYEMSKNLVKLWVSFARGDKDINFLGKKLTQLHKDAKQVKYLKLDNPPDVISEPNPERMKFWKENSLIQ